MEDLKDKRDESIENNKEEQQYETVNLEDLVSQLEKVLDPIQLPIENLSGVEFDKYNFSKGLKEISFVCGMLTGLMNIGLSAKDSLDYILNKENIKHNQILQDKINKNNIEVSKVNTVKIEQAQDQL
jgi:hypothetical protein